MKVLETPTRSQFLWLADGNVVIQAEATQYKVYRGLLTLHSAIFNDMFALPQPPLELGEQFVEGCAVVHLSDTAADVSIVLETLFLRRCSGEPLPLEVVAVFLRLGSKYEIETLRAEALKLLFFEFPSDLAGFDKILYGGYRGTMIQFEVDWKFIDFTNLAREHDILSILPIALYWCCRRWPAADLEQGQRRTDNTISTLHPVNERACFRAYLEIVKLKQITFDWAICPQSHYPACTSRDRCSSAHDQLLRAIFIPVAVKGWIDAWKDAYEEGQYKTCILVAKQLHDGERKRAWDALPAAFSLPAWEELNKERSTHTWCAVTSH
ncbi:hypothetical protein FIBSPDRAFT_841794 [Athelia psychrophila]|uniref:BTB domain-containing protein n=1 Tax=Athelia psychrophila TaxID=1759441 RepID=A0A167X3R9_9AGAM|nr:hypothetical protein FIBSPDRAFT_841794 [Fibularhizoctonia sp. CBS 109695]